MATAFLDISAALDANLNTLALANNIPVAWENSSYTPVTGRAYLRATLLPADTDGLGLADNSTDEHLGIYQVDVFAPIDTGKGQAVMLADSIADQFKRGTELIYNGVKVRIKTVSRSTGSRDGSWFIVPVYIQYYSFTQSR